MAKSPRRLSRARIKSHAVQSPANAGDGKPDLAAESATDDAAPYVAAFAHVDACSRKRAGPAYPTDEAVTLAEAEIEVKFADIGAYRTHLLQTRSPRHSSATLNFVAKFQH